MGIVTDLSHRIDALADQLAANGYLTDPAWRQALHAVPRHLFAPTRGYAMPSVHDGPQARTIDRNTDPADWWEALYSDMAIVTQREDGKSDPASPDGTATCSLSAPGIV